MAWELLESRLKSLDPAKHVDLSKLSKEIQKFRLSFPLPNEIEKEDSVMVYWNAFVKAVRWLQIPTTKVIDEGRLT